MSHDIAQADQTTISLRPTSLRQSFVIRNMFSEEHRKFRSGSFLGVNAKFTAMTIEHVFYDG